jgi:hypothetical protein
VYFPIYLVYFDSFRQILVSIWTGVIDEGPPTIVPSALPSPSPTPAAGGNILEVAAANNLDTFLAAVNAAGLDPTIGDPSAA